MPFIDPEAPVHTRNLAGYRLGHAPTAGGRHTFGGLTGSAFRMITFIEAGAADRRPF